MRMSRRAFLGRTSVVALGAMPSLVLEKAFADDKPSLPDDGRILVVIQMSGGNDGVNTVVPFADEGYAKHRNKLRLPGERLLKIDDSVALHPSMRSAADMLEDGRLAIVQGVGYPNPNRSHDTSMAIWHSGIVGDGTVTRSHGWLGKALDSSRDQDRLFWGSDPDMVLLGDESQPLAIHSRRSMAVSISELDELQLRDGRRQHHLERQRKLHSDGSLDRFVRQTMSSAIATSHSLSQLSQRFDEGSVAYPATRLANRMRSIATLIKSGFRTPVYYAIQSGYDTHASQLPTHSRLLREFSDAIKSFLNDLGESGLSDHVCVLGFSEFGRRVAENGSAGTDHGTAGPVFLAGDHVRGGLLGQTPELTNLVDGDLRMGIDFRNVYAAVARDWLGAAVAYPGLQPSTPLNLFDV